METKNRMGTRGDKGRVNAPAASDDRQFLVILNRPPPFGFFATFRQVLGELWWCKTTGAVPVVFFNRDWVYWSQDKPADATNMWEAYFEPVSNYSITDLIDADLSYLEQCRILDFDNERIIPCPNHRNARFRRSHIPVPPNVTLTNRWPDLLRGENLERPDLHHVLHELTNEFIRVRPAILEKVGRFYDRFFRGRRVIGVHIRGREHNIEIEGWHHMARAPEKLYMREIDTYLRSTADADIFVATDTVSILEMFEKRYGERVRSTNARRSVTGRAPHCETTGYDIGEEVLVDGLLLARCDFLVHGISSVSNAALSFNPDVPRIDVYSKYERRLRWALRLKRVIRGKRPLPKAAATLGTTEAKQSEHGRGE